MKRVLIIDDEKSLANSFQEGFIRYRKEFLTDVAFSAEEAFALIDQHSYCVVVSDIRLPDKSGLDVLLKLREMKSEAAFIAMTAFSTPDVKNSVLNMGGLHYLEKPFEFKELENLVLSLVRRGKKESGHDSGNDFLQSLELSSIAQLINMEGKTLKLQIASSVGEGILVFKKGELVHASFGHMAGIDAAVKIFSLRNFRLEMKTPEKTEKQTISTPLMNILMRSMQQIDEKGREIEPAAEKKKVGNGAYFQETLAREMEKLKRIGGVLNSAAYDEQGNCLYEVSVSPDVSLDQMGKSMLLLFQDLSGNGKNGGLGTAKSIQMNSNQGILLSRSIMTNQRGLYFCIHLSSGENLAMARKSVDEIAGKLMKSDSEYCL